MVIKELYKNNDDINARDYAYQLSNDTELLDKANMVSDFFSMIEDIYYDMESGKDVLSNSYEKNQFLAELEIAETMFEDMVAVIDEYQDVI